MSRFTKKDWVCLASPEEVAQHRAAQDKGQMAGRALMAPLWRQIAISATPELITVHLGNVDEEAARGGYCSGSYAARQVKLAWDDINDCEGLARLFEHEQVCVMQKVGEMVATLREHMVPLRLVLAA